MGLNKSLDLLALAENFKIEKPKAEYDDWCYKISEKNGDLCAFFELDGSIKYYVTGVYNSGIDVAEIDVKRLNKLITFCNLMVENSK
jgi:hypothetical protein